VPLSRKNGALRVQRYYELAYPESGDESPNALAQLDDLMRTGVDFRMRADVPVGGYLSGGLDSVGSGGLLSAGGNRCGRRAARTAIDRASGAASAGVS
jgi:hypothetical protein